MKKAKPKVEAKAKPKAKARTVKAKKAAAVELPVVVPAAPSPDLKSVYRSFVDDLVNGGRFETSSQYLDDVVTSHNPFPGQAPGREGFVTALRAFREAFPDLHARATHVVAEGELITARFEVTGTHRGPFMGIAPTGNPVHYEEMTLVRFAGGRIVEHWSIADALAIVQQLQL